MIVNILCALPPDNNHYPDNDEHPKHIIFALYKELRMA